MEIQILNEDVNPEIKNLLNLASDASRKCQESRGECKICPYKGRTKTNSFGGKTYFCILADDISKFLRESDLGFVRDDERCSLYVKTNNYTGKETMDFFNHLQEITLEAFLSK